MSESLAKWQQPDTIQTSLNAKNIAIVGLSSNPLRASHFVGLYLLNNGYQITPVNPTEKEIFGLTCYPNLLEIPHEIDLVDVFRAPDAAPGIAQEAATIGADFLWLQFGVISPDAIAIAEAAQITCVVDRCIKIEHARYRGRMHWLGFNTEQISARRREP